MSTSATVRGSVHRDVSARRFRDPLQVPIGLGFDDEIAAPTVLQAARDFAVWLAIVCGAALAVFFVAASVPELKAATHHHASATAASASSAQRVSEHQRADTGS